MEPQDKTESQKAASSNEPEHTVRPSIYPNATRGRLQNATEPNPEEQRIISANIDGSPEYEAFKQNIREAESVRLDDNLYGRIVFCTIALFALAFADRLYGVFLPIIGWITKGVGLIFVSFLAYYIIRQIQIGLASRRYKKNRKKNS